MLATIVPSTVAMIVGVHELYEVLSIPTPAFPLNGQARVGAFAVYSRWAARIRGGGVVEVDMSQLNARFQEALRLHQAGQIADAAVLYETVLKEQPQHADALNLSGVAASQMGRHQEGLERIDRAIALRPGLAPYRSNRGAVLVEMGRHAEAVASYEQALKIQPRDGRTIYNLGAAYHLMGQLKLAIDCYQKAAVLNPNGVDISNSLGCALRDSGDLAGALVNLHKATTLAPKHAAAHQNLGKTFKTLGRMDEAIAFYRRAVALDPTNAATHSDLLYVIQFDPAYDAAAVLREHRAWNDLHAAPLARFIRGHDKDCSPQRPAPD